MFLILLIFLHNSSCITGLSTIDATCHGSTSTKEIADVEEIRIYSARNDTRRCSCRIMYLLAIKSISKIYISELRRNVDRQPTVNLLDSLSNIKLLNISQFSETVEEVQINEDIYSTQDTIIQIKIGITFFRNVVIKY